MMNNVNLIGQISSPIDVKAIDKLQFVNFTLYVQREGSNKFDTIPCVAMDDCVEKLKECIRVSNFVKIEGKIRTRNTTVEILAVDVQPYHNQL